MKAMAKKLRALRRAQLQRMKARARRVLLLRVSGRAQLDPVQIGIHASTHGRPCSCWLCKRGNQEAPPPRERAFAEYDSED
jgi:hypothetical protein